MAISGIRLSDWLHHKAHDGRPPAAAASSQCASRPWGQDKLEAAGLGSYLKVRGWLWWRKVALSVDHLRSSGDRGRYGETFAYDDHNQTFSLENLA